MCGCSRGTCETASPTCGVSERRRQCCRSVSSDCIGIGTGRLRGAAAASAVREGRGPPAPVRWPILLPYVSLFDSVLLLHNSVLYVLVARLWVLCARAEDVPLGSCHEYWLAGYRAPGAYSVQKTLPVPSLYCASLPAASLTLASAAASCTVSPQMPTPLSADTLPYAALPALFSVADHSVSRRPFLLAAPNLLPPNVLPPTASSTPNATQNKSSGPDESGLFVSQVQYACGLDALALARRSAYCTQRLRFWCYRSSIKWAPT